MSTSRKASGVPTSKKFSSCVRPGVFEVRARPLRLASAFNSEDLPTFERPAKATSGTTGRGEVLELGRRLEEGDRAGEDLSGGFELVFVESSPARGRGTSEAGGGERNH